jgi:GNAT superfamily N-acetyltransferase
MARRADVQVRDAMPEDADAACDVLRRSITELCAADHRDEPAALQAWLANKTPEIVAAWTRQAGNSLLLAVEGNAVLAVGAVTDAGEITLNYVAPEARFRGVSRAMLSALEVRAAERGNHRCTLTSTATAHRFYRSAGYLDEGTSVTRFGMDSGYSMSKRIVA